MKTRPSYEKLGLLVLLAIAAVVVFAFVLGIRTSPTDTYHTYFDETVQGLETGAFVKYRGVKIGTVGAIAIAPDGKHIDVTLELDREQAKTLAIADSAPNLRARLAIVGITGLKLVDIEPARDNAPPPPKLTFPTPERYIPARHSMMGGLAGVAERVSDKLPAVLDRATATLALVEMIAKDAQQANLPGRIANATDRVADAATEIRQSVRRLDGSTNKAMTRLNTILDRVDAPDGLVASARRATDSIGDVSRSARTSAGDLERTMRDLRDAARAMRGFFEDLGRQPDMLVKGRTSKSRSQ